MEGLWYFLSAGALGVFLGAQLAEALLLVPYWKSLSADNFYTHYQKMGPRLQRFFSPLTIAATLLPILAAGHSFYTGDTSRWLALFVALLAILFFSTYFLYFKAANVSFIKDRLKEDQLAIVLTKWSKWHWSRVLLEAVAFMLSLYLLLNV